MIRRTNHPGGVALALLAFLVPAPPCLAGTAAANTSAANRQGPLIESVSRVTSVTVFRNRARVTRTVSIELPAGEHKVVFRGLPSVFDPDTARVGGRGRSGITIRSLELRPEPIEAKPSPEAERTWKEIEMLEHDRALLQERLVSIDFLCDLLTQFRGTLATGSSGAAPTGSATSSPTAVPVGQNRVDLTLWAEGYRFLSEKLDAIAAEKRQGVETIATMGHDIDLRRATLLPPPPARRGPTFTAEVIVTAEQAGSATIALTYLSADASWSPIYDARLLPAEGRLSLAAFGQIRQETGEDWSGVDITLSSTRPLAALDLPRLTSLYIRGPQRASGGFVRIAPSSEMIDGLSILGRNYQDVLTLAPGVTDTDGDSNPNIHGARDVEVIASLASAEPETRPAGVVYRLPGRLDIPSDGQPHRHLIVERDLPATIEYRSAPALDHSVYVVARATLPADLTLLPGPVQHFMEKELVGRSNLPAAPPSSPLELGFGPEERIVVERREEEKRAPRGGGDIDLRLRFATTFRNQTGRAVTVLLTERLPISEDAAIRVALDERDTTEGRSQDDKTRGVFRWTLAIPPAQSRDLVFAYSVRSPRGQALEIASARP